MQNAPNEHEQLIRNILKMKIINYQKSKTPRFNNHFSQIGKTLANVRNK